jgi:uncharacterized membrane protein YGL010W
MTRARSSRDYNFSMRTIEEFFADYASHHRTLGNKWFHRFGIPMIMLTLLGMLARVELVRVGAWAVDAAMLLIAVSTIWYVALEWRLGIVMALVAVGMYLVGRALPMSVNIAFFVLGWIFQFIGHSVYEKRQPAFFKNVTHLLIGPLWILNDVIPVVKTRVTA